MINYPFEISPYSQHDLLSKTILFDDLNIHPVGFMIKYPLFIAASNNSTLEMTIRGILEEFSADVIYTSLLLIHTQFVGNFSAAAPVY